MGIVFPCFVTSFLLVETISFPLNQVHSSFRKHVRVLQVPYHVYYTYMQWGRAFNLLGKSSKKEDQLSPSSGKRQKTSASH